MELLISLYPLHLRYQFPTFKEFMREGALSFRLLPEIGDFMYSEDFDICNGKLPAKMGKPTIQSFMEGEHSFGSYCERVICRQENIDCRQKYEEFVTHMENHHDGNSGDPFWMGVNSPGPSLVDGTRNRDTRYRYLEEYKYDLGEAPLPKSKKASKKSGKLDPADSARDHAKDDQAAVQGDGKEDNNAEKRDSKKDEEDKDRAGKDELADTEGDKKSKDKVQETEEDENGKKRDSKKDEEDKDRAGKDQLADTEGNKKSKDEVRETEEDKGLAQGAVSMEEDPLSNSNMQASGDRNKLDGDLEEKGDESTSKGSEKGDSDREEERENGKKRKSCADLKSTKRRKSGQVRMG